MAVSVADLRGRFAEFAATADAVLSRALGEATRRTSPNFNDAYDDAVMLRAAHLVAVSPQGLNARLDTKPGDDPLMATAYGQELLALMRERFGGPHMVGIGPLR